MRIALIVDMNHKNKTFFFVLCGALITMVLGTVCARAETSAMPDSFLLSVGEQKSIPLERGSRFSVGNADVIHARLTVAGAEQNILIVRAKAVGFSDLLIWSKRGDQQHYQFQVEATKKSAPIFSKRLAIVDEKSRERGEKELRSLLEKAKLDHLQVRGIGTLLVMEGVAKTKEEKDFAERLAASVFPSTKSYIQLPFDIKDILKFKVQILELVKSKQNSSGFTWSEGIPSIIQMHQLLLKGAISLDASLALLAKQGQARILSQPEIAVNAEGVAELKVGGEIPVPLKSHQFASVQWKSYGLTLRLDVPGVSNNLARTNVLVEVSTLDHVNAADGIPATKLNRMQTVIDLTMGKTIFLSGLMQNISSENLQSFPLLGDIPILGALFRSKAFQEQKTELVIAITAQRGGGI